MMMVEVTVLDLSGNGGVGGEEEINIQKNG